MKTIVVIVLLFNANVYSMKHHKRDHHVTLINMSKKELGDIVLSDSIKYNYIKNKKRLGCTPRFRRFLSEAYYDARGYIRSL